MSNQFIFCLLLIDVHSIVIGIVQNLRQENAALKDQNRSQEKAKDLIPEPESSGIVLIDAMCLRNDKKRYNMLRVSSF